MEKTKQESKNNKNKKINVELILDKKTNKYYTNESILIGISRHVFLNAGYVLDPNGNPVFAGDDLSPGLFTRNVSGWDIQKACQWVHNHAGASSLHQCAKYIRCGIEAGGVSTTGRPAWAWKYINFLPSIGFKFIDKVDNDYNGEHGSYTPQPGDIAVYTKGGDTNAPGHICMWTGAEWASDFRQKKMIVYSSTPQAYIFRFES